MKKIVLVVIGLLLSSNIAIGQEEENIDYKPAKKTFTVSLLLGKGKFIESGSARKLNVNQVSGDVPYNTSIDNNYNSLTNMVGLEGKYFVIEDLALTFLGGMSLRSTPSHINLPEVRGLGGEVIVPSYNAIVGEDDFDMHFSLGAQRYLNLNSSNRLIPYVGVAVPINYSRSTVMDPTVNSSGSLISYGTKHVELFGIGLQGVAGLDYYLTKELFIGFDIVPLSYTYLMNTKKARPGTLGRRADNNSISFLSNYNFKIGFKL